MITLQIRVDDFIERAQRMDANLKQLPFALSLAMNRAATQTRSALIETTWPRGVTVRNTTFLRAALRMEFASKHDLSVAIYDSLGRAALPLHDKGGVKIGKGKLAIPLSAVRRTSRQAALSWKFVRAQRCDLSREGQGRTQDDRAHVCAAPPSAASQAGKFYRRLQRLHGGAVAHAVPASACARDQHKALNATQGSAA
jgi:hypothetical protein